MVIPPSGGGGNDHLFAPRDVSYRIGLAVGVGEQPGDSMTTSTPSAFHGKSAGVGADTLIPCIDDHTRPPPFQRRIFSTHVRFEAPWVDHTQR